MAPDPVRAALYGCLSGDAALEGLLSTPGAIFEEKAPQGTDPPYVIFQRQAGTAQWTFGPSNERAIWLVKAICRGGSSTPAEEIDTRCEELLDRTQLAVTGGTLTILRESAVSYGEASDGDEWRHRGGFYRIFT